MNAAIVWKEYRQLRGIWIVITLLAILALEGLLATVGSTTSWLDHINTSRIVLFSIVVSSIAAHGIVVGAMLMARDREDGTEVFLDSLTFRRSSVWWNKLFAGLVMVILQGLAMVALLVAHGVGSIETDALLPLLGVATLAWGALGGVLCRHVLSATLLAVLLMAISWLLAFPFGIAPELFLSTEGVFSLGALLAAQHIYCQTDQMRLPEMARHATVRFLARNLAIVLGLFVALALMFSAYSKVVSFQLTGPLLIAADLGLSVAIVFMLRVRFNGWQLILLAGGLAGIAFLISARLVALPIARIPELFLAVEVGACFGAALLSRVPPRKRLDTPKWRLAWPALLGSWRSTIWLVSRQGRWVFLGAAFLALISGATARLAPMFIWPIGSMTVGILCGLGVFCPDQRDGRVFWASQRLPALRIWFTKVFTWGILLAAALICGGLGNFWWSLRANTVEFRPTGWLERWQNISSHSSFGTERALNLDLFALMWPIYGFSMALLLGQLTSRAIIAATLTAVAVPSVLALWLPSFLIGGLSVWQVMLIPGLLLLASAAIQHAWIAGRLASLKSIAIITTCLLAVLGWLAGSLWHRATEVPDVGEPFDQIAFLAQLPEPSETGPDLLAAIRDFYRGTAQIEKEFVHRPTGDASKDSGANSQAEEGNWTRIGAFDRHVWLKRSKTLAPELDKLFKSPSFAKIQRLAASPLGLIQDVRKDRSFDNVALGNTEVDRLANLLDWRIGQLIEKQDYSGALQLLETGFGVGRQLENYAPVSSYVNGVNIQLILLQSGLDRWLQTAQSDRSRLLAAQELVRRHLALCPDPAGAIKTQSIISKSIEPFSLASGSPLDLTYRRLAIQVPWEAERQRRVRRASIYGALTALRTPRMDRTYVGWPQLDRNLAMAAESAELPPTFGPGSDVPAETWGEYVLQSYPSGGFLYSPLIQSAARQSGTLQASQVAIALCLYQFDHQKPPSRLEDLVPSYLPAIPVDPRGKSVVVVWVEADEVALPCVIAILVSQTSLPGQAPWQVTLNLGNISRRLPLSMRSQAAGVPGVAGGGLAEFMPEGMGDEGPGPEPLPLIAPRPMVNFGGYTFGYRPEPDSETLLLRQLGFL